jgi:hypothetical protein
LGVGDSRGGDLKEVDSIDMEFARALEPALTEWGSDEDDEAYHEL